MKLEPIEYNGGVIWVDKNPEGYKKGEWCYGEPNNSELLYQFDEDLFPYYLGNKVVAQSPNLSIPNIPYVEVGEDIEDVVKKFTNELDLNGWEQNGFRKGYKAASTKKWSDEDIEKAIQFGIDITCKHTTPTHGTNFDKVEDDKNNYVTSLQPKIKSIEIEMEKVWDKVDPNDFEKYSKVQPITYQKDGKTFLKVKKINT